MLIDSLQTIKQHVGLGPQLIDGIERILAIDLFILEPGDYHLVEGEVIVKIMDRELSHPPAKPYEVHQRYIDIHIPLSGTEVLGYISGKSRMTIVAPFDSDKDIGFADSHEKHAEAWLTIPPGGLVIFYPGEWHKPACSLDASYVLRKAVIKIKAPSLR